MDSDINKFTYQSLGINPNPSGFIPEYKLPRLAYNKIPNKKVWIQDGNKLVKKEFKLNKKREIKNWKRYKPTQFKIKND